MPRLRFPCIDFRVASDEAQDSSGSPLMKLFDAYNRRVTASEPDPSLLVEVPENLTQT